MLRRQFADQFLEPNVGAVHQDFTPIFRAPSDVVFTRVDDVQIRFVVHGTSISHVYCILCGGKKEQGSRARLISPWMNPGALRRFQVTVSSLLYYGEQTACDQLTKVIAGGGRGDPCHLRKVAGWPGLPIHQSHEDGRPPGVINIALPTLQSAWKSSVPQVTWTVIVYAMSLTATMMFWGRWAGIASDVCESSCGGCCSLVSRLPCAERRHHSLC